MDVKVNEIIPVENGNEEIKFNDISAFEKDLTQLDEMKPIESPAILWGKWGAIFS